MPSRIKYAPIVFVTAKLIAPCSGPSSSSLNPASAYAATPISSNQTNMLKRSPLSAKPAIAPANTSTSALYARAASLRYVQERTSASSASPQQSAAMPADSGSATKAMPSTTPSRGSQPPNQCRSPSDSEAAIATSANAVAVA